MLIIEPGDEVVLSPEYHALHNISVWLHDQMAYLTKHEDYEWFQQAPKGVTDDPVDALARDILQALMVDFLHFVYESLSAAKKGKSGSLTPCCASPSPTCSCCWSKF